METRCLTYIGKECKISSSGIVNNGIASLTLLTPIANKEEEEKNT
jgi:hypothetical protein